MSEIVEYLFEPFYWWVVKAPKKIFIVLKRMTILVNNDISFSLNIKLLFTPLFGDYTFMGRVIGFVVRVMEIFFGFIFVAFLGIVTLIGPVLWWTSPVAIYYFVGIWVIPLIISVLIVHIVLAKGIPLRRVKEIKVGGDVLMAFRPRSKMHAEKIHSLGSTALKSLVNEPAISFYLRKLELLDNNFLNELIDDSSLNARNVKKTAFDYSADHQIRYVELEYVFLAVLSNVANIDRLLAKYGSSLDICEGTAKWIVGDREKLAKVYFWQEDYDITLLGGVGKGMTGRVTPALNSVSEDFTKDIKVNLVERVIGREKDIEKIASILGSSRENVLIIGEPGSGKTSIVRRMAYDVIRGTKYESLKNKRIVSVSSGSLISGAKTTGDVAEKVRRILDEVAASGDIILFIDEVHNLVTGIGDDSTDVASVYSILEPYLSSGRFRVLAATNIQNYRKYIEPNGAFARLFNVEKIDPATPEDTIEILKYIASDFEDRYKVTISYPAIKKTVDLSQKLIHERVFPDKAIDVLNRAVVSAGRDTKFVTANIIAKEISEMTKIPVDSISEDESKKLLNIEDKMKERVIGQDEAIAQLGRALKRARVGIRDEKRPIASFLFVGTTGVGKTETAKTLSRIYFGSEKAMIRRDMSEYQQIDSINKLIGTPSGDTIGSLTDDVRSAPFSVVLLDEIEKSHSNVLHAFLQVLDDGRLTDSTGRTVDFTNTIIIATSNVGTRSIQKISERGGSFEEIQTAVMQEVRKSFAPEFLNRFTGIVVFKPLKLDNVRKIADILLSRVRKMADEKGVVISFKPELISELVKRGFSKEWGARPLARVIEDSVETFLSIKLLSGEVKQGDTLELGHEVFEGSTLREGDAHEDDEDVPRPNHNAEWKDLPL